MFLTITIDTKKQKKEKAMVRFHKKIFSVKDGIRNPFLMKKRGMFQRIKDWRKHSKGGLYKIGGQVAMF